MKTDVLTLRQVLNQLQSQVTEDFTESLWAFKFGDIASNISEVFFCKKFLSQLSFFRVR